MKNEMGKAIRQYFKRLVAQKNEKGTSLVEVLVALLLLQILMLGILQMFSMAFVINRGSEARTEMTYRAQQVLENIRYLNSLYRLNPSSISTLDLSPISFPLTAGTTYDFTTIASPSTNYWGPSQADIINDDTNIYQIYASVTDSGANWTVVVTVRADAAKTSFLKGKVIEYGAQIPK